MAIIVGQISIEGGPMQNFLAQTVESPVIPPEGPGGTPEHPIVPPGGYPGPGHPIVPPGGYPHPEHPIVIPPDQPPSLPVPPDRWCWRYDDDLGWVLVPPGGGGKPQPVPPG